MGLADYLDNGKTKDNVLYGVSDATDISPHCMVPDHVHHSSKPLFAVNPNGNTILENLCTGNPDVNIHADLGASGTIRGIIDANFDAYSNLGF